MEVNNVLQIAETYSLRGFMTFCILFLSILLIYMVISVVHDLLKKQRLKELKEKIEICHQNWLEGA